MEDPCEKCPLKVDCVNSCKEKVAYEATLDKLDADIDEASVRTHEILVIKSRRSFDVKPDDNSKVELNEGYEFETNAPIPEIADGLAKMAIEMDKMTELGENAGTMFLTLIAEFYKKLKEGGDK